MQRKDSYTFLAKRVSGQDNQRNDGPHSRRSNGHFAHGSLSEEEEEEEEEGEEVT